LLSLIVGSVKTTCAIRTGAREAIALIALGEVPLSFEEAKAKTFGFGKHKGKSVGSLARKGSGRSYLKYQLTWSGLRAPMEEAILLVLQKYAEAKAARD
jgi:hypothetical protein